MIRVVVHRARLLKGICSIGGILLATAIARAQSPEFWQGQSIYQIITDRFFDGTTTNNNAEGTYNPTDSRGVHGGDFKGLEQKLDYIKALGATAIWISPVVLNANGEFHGYAGRDFYSVAPHWGSLADLQQMVAAAHARGMLVIQDIVVNHGGDLVHSTDSGYANFKYPGGYNLRYRSAARQYAPPFNTNAVNPTLASLFHNHGAIQDYNNPTQAELGELLGLDDFRTESAYVRTNMAAVYQFWIAQAGFDGFRVDTVKHVEMGFWQDWCPPVRAFAAANGRPDFFMFGEVYDGSDAKCGSYTGTQGGGPFKLDSVLDFPLYFRVNSVFATATGNTRQIEDRYAAIPANYDPAAQMRLVTFLDNHDVPRFLSSGNANNNTNRLSVALVFLYTARGIPCLYYGTEQAFNSGGDPNNREDMFDGRFEQGPSLGDNFNMTHPLFQLVAKLNNLRRLYPALRTGTHANLWNNPSGPGLFAYARQLGGTQEVFVVFNTAAASQTLPSRPTLYPAGTTLVNLLDPGENITVVAGSQTPSILVPGTSAKVFIAQSQMLPLDPVVLSVSPPHDAANVPTASPLVIRFSGAMLANTVEAAFSTVPAVPGSFSWNVAHDTMTFTPGGGGWPALATITVRIGGAATDAISGNRLIAAFESRFATGVTTDNLPPAVAVQTPTNGAVVAGNLTVAGTATDNVAVQKVEVQLDNRGWLLASGTNSWTYTLNTSNFLNGPHLLHARATDSAGNISTTNSITVRFFNVPGSYLQRLSAGNPSNVTDCAANVWLRDQAYGFGSFGYAGGTTGYLANTITGVCASAQSLYQRERYSISSSGFRYLFDCPAGIYETTLLEAETWVNGPNQRVFNVFIEGQQVLANFDIFAAAGGKNLPLARSFTNSAADAQLEIQFLPLVDNARASGVQVRKIGDLFSDNDGIPDWWRLGYFGHATGQAADQSRASDDADGDGMCNGDEFLAGTDPLDPASVFQITRIEIIGSQVQISWSSRANRIYQLQGRATWSGAGGWTNLGPTVVGTDGILTQTVNGSAETSRFYRVLAY